jgi:hypothetical protein
MKDWNRFYALHFIEQVYEIAFGDGAIDKEFTRIEVLEKLRELKAKLQELKAELKKYKEA